MNIELNKKFGALLKTERERQGIDLDELAEKLKIIAANLQAIEEGDASQLPSELYFSLFSKTYAEALGIDYNRTVEAIKEDLNGTNGKDDKTESKKVNEKKSKIKDGSISDTGPFQNEFIKKGAYILGGIIVIFIIFIVINNLFFIKDEELINTDTGESVETVETIEPKDEDLDVVYANYDWNTPEFKKPEKLMLTLVSNKESWSTVLADGDTILYRTLIPGRVYQVEANHRLLVSVGIPSVVTTTLNGVEVDLRDADSRRISRVLINQMNRDSFLNPQSESKQEIDSPPKKTTVEGTAIQQAEILTEDTDTTNTESGSITDEE